jgi:hypothetical protein
MANRIFYASHGVSVGGSTVTGAQSVSVNTNFDLEQVFQLGRLAIYDNIQSDPDVEVTISKVLDGGNSIYNLATTGGGTLIDNANDQVTIVLGIGSDTQDVLSTSAAVTMTGMYLSSVNYTLPVDGNFTEEVSFLGSSKTLSGSVSAPAAAPGVGVVARRQNLSSTSNLPSEVEGKNISNITVSADLGREKMYKLGQFAPFHRFVNFPLEITVSFDVIATSHDGQEVIPVTEDCTGPDYSTQTIVLEICDNTGATQYTIDLGTKCVLSSVSYSGGDATGGNVTITYTYITYNDLNITG